MSLLSEYYQLMFWFFPFSDFGGLKSGSEFLTALTFQNWFSLSIQRTVALDYHFSFWNSSCPCLYALLNVCLLYYQFDLPEIWIDDSLCDWFKTSESLDNQYAQVCMVRFFDQNSLDFLIKIPTLKWYVQYFNYNFNFALKLKQLLYQ